MAVLAAKNILSTALSKIVIFTDELSWTYLQKSWVQLICLAAMSDSLGSIVSIALFVLLSYLVFKNAAGWFASFLRNLSWASVEMMGFENFQGFVKVPAEVMEAMEGGGAKAWSMSIDSQLTGFAVCLLLPLSIERPRETLQFCDVGSSTLSGLTAYVIATQENAMTA